MAKLKKEKIPFTQVANEVINDEKLSWKAKGIFAYIFSKPNGWDFAGERIAKDSIDGRWATNKGLKELEIANYLVRKKLGNGRIIYYIKFSDKNPDVENLPLDTDPKCKNRKVQKPQSAKTCLISNIDIISNIDKKNNIDSVFTFLMDFYFQVVLKIHGYKPKIAAKDGASLKRAISEYGEEETKQMIDYYLNSAKAKEIGVSLSYVFTPHSVNAFRQHGHRSKFF